MAILLLLMPIAASAGLVPKPSKSAPPTASPPSTPTPPPSLIPWRTDVEAAIKDATAGNRLIMIYFRADWCKPCELVERGPFAIPVFATFVSQNFITVKADDTKELSAATKQFRIRAYPTLLFLSSSGEPMHAVTGPQTAPVLHAVMKQVMALPGLIEAQKKAPDDVEANFKLATAWTDLDHLQQAEPFLKRVVELDPKNEKGHLDMGRLLLAIVPAEDGKVDQAIKNLDEFMAAYKDSPEIASAMFLKGKVLAEDGRLQEARKVFDDLREKFPTSLKAYEADKIIDAIDVRLKAEKAAVKPPADVKEKPAPAP